MNEKDRLRDRYIPENVFQGKRVFKIFKMRNFREGIIGFLLILCIVARIPFVSHVKWIVTICVGLTVLLFIAVGIKNQSLSEFIINVFKFKKYKKIFHYRRLTDATTSPKDLVVNGKVATIKENQTKNKIKFFFRGKEK